LSMVWPIGSQRPDGDPSGFANRHDQIVQCLMAFLIGCDFIAVKSRYREILYKGRVLRK
jgi:hypothetical protein